MSEERPTGGVDQSEFLALIGDLRPELHRYCARLTGSVIDGEDVVQDSLASAFVALKTLEAAPSLRAWVFRIAHNRALDLLRSRAIRAAEPLEAASETPDSQAADPLEALMRQEAVRTAVSRFVDLPTAQRSVVILKDVLGHSLEDIAMDVLDQRKADRENSEADFFRALHSGVEGSETLFQMARNVFDDHDGVVDNEAGGDGERHQRKVIDREAEQVHYAAGSQQRQRNRH